MSFNNHVSSQEMYLKAISKLLKKQGSCCATDISEEMGYKRPSVSNALKLLEEGHYIERDANRRITLTEKGRQTTDFVEKRYEVCHAILLEMGLTEEEAARTACQFEHIIDREICEKLNLYLHHVMLNREACPQKTMRRHRNEKKKAD